MSLNIIMVVPVFVSKGQISTRTETFVHAWSISKHTRQVKIITKEILAGIVLSVCMFKKHGTWKQVQSVIDSTGMLLLGMGWEKKRYQSYQKNVSWWKAQTGLYNLLFDCNKPSGCVVWTEIMCAFTDPASPFSSAFHTQGQALRSSFMLID